MIAIIQNKEKKKEREEVAPTQKARRKNCFDSVFRSDVLSLLNSLFSLFFLFVLVSVFVFVSALNKDQEKKKETLTDVKICICLFSLPNLLVR